MQQKIGSEHVIIVFELQTEGRCCKKKKLVIEFESLNSTHRKLM